MNIMPYSILIPGAIEASNVDSLVKFAIDSVNNLENGNLVKLGALSSNAIEHEVFLAATPVTATLDADIFYMVNEPVLVTVNAKYRGLTDDPTEFNIAKGKVFTCYKPRVGDEIIISEDGLGGTKSSNTYVVPANNSAKLTWAANTTGVSLGYELIETTYIEVPSSTFYGRRKTAYKFRCVKA